VASSSATCSSETSVDFQRTPWRYNPEDSITHNYLCLNLKSYDSNSISVPYRDNGVRTRSPNCRMLLAAKSILSNSHTFRLQNNAVKVIRIGESTCDILRQFFINVYKGITTLSPRHQLILISGNNTAQHCCQYQNPVHKFPPTASSA
jgi:hypothetical protein